MKRTYKMKKCTDCNKEQEDWEFESGRNRETGEYYTRKICRQCSYKRAEVLNNMEKMSKSKGNVVTIDEVVYGVLKVADGYEFRDENSNIIDAVNRVYKKGNSYWLFRKYGGRPVFLHIKDEPVPPLVIDKVQHPDHIDYWHKLLLKHDPEYINPFGESQ